MVRASGAAHARERASGRAFPLDRTLAADACSGRRRAGCEAEMIPEAAPCRERSGGRSYKRRGARGSQWQMQKLPKITTRGSDSLHPLQGISMRVVPAPSNSTDISMHKLRTLRHVRAYQRDRALRATIHPKGLNEHEVKTLGCELLPSAIASAQATGMEFRSPVRRRYDFAVLNPWKPSS